MMKETTFIRWPKVVDVQFRRDYLAETGEAIQTNPVDDGDHFWVGSSRITQAQVDKILSSYATVKTGKTLMEAKLK